MCAWLIDCVYAAIRVFTGLAGVTARKGALSGALADSRKPFMSLFDDPFTG